MKISIKSGFLLLSLCMAHSFMHLELLAMDTEDAPQRETRTPEQLRQIAQRLAIIKALQHARQEQERLEKERQEREQKATAATEEDDTEENNGDER